MGRLGYAAVLGLLLGCTRLNPAYGDAAGGDGDSVGVTSIDQTSAAETANGPDPSLPTDPTLPSNPTLPTSPTGSTTQVDPTNGSETTSSGITSFDLGGSTTESVEVCSTYAQDCPVGEKCMPYSDSGGNTWNAVDCFPLDPAPRSPGDPCVVEGSPVSGLDDCGQQSMCWDVNTETFMGTCVSFCLGSADSPFCDDPQRTCATTNDGILALCLATCDPLTQDCAGGSSCTLLDDQFVCVPDASGDAGEPGDPCAFVNDCVPGTLCAPPASLPDCLGIEGCCTPFCDTALTDCVMPLDCVALFAKGNAPPGQENVGFCALP